MCVRDERAHVSRRALRALDVREEGRDGARPVRTVRVVEAVQRAGAGHAYVGLRQVELAGDVVQREHVHAAAEGDDDVRGGAVQAVAGDQQVGAFLQQRCVDIDGLRRLRGSLRRSVYTEDSASW